MATRVINVTLGTRAVGGGFPAATASHASGAASNASFTYDDTVITSLDHARAALQLLGQAIQANASFTR
jgi:hypothetical protein